MNVLDDQCGISVKSRDRISVCHIMDRNEYWGKSSVSFSVSVFVCVRALKSRHYRLSFYTVSTLLFCGEQLI